MKLKVAFWLLVLSVVYLFGSNILKDGYSVQAALALAAFNPLTWALFVVGAFMARRTAQEG
jgi:hypothetical protein